MSEVNNSLSLKSTILTIRSYLIYLLRKWWVYLLALLLALAISFLFLSIRPDKYKAHVTFMTNTQQDSGMSSILQMAGQFGVVAPSSGNSLSADKLIELMGTRTMLLNALLKTGLVEGDTDLLLNHYLKMQNKYSEDGRFQSIQVEDFSYQENDMADDIIDQIRRLVLEANSSENGIIRATVTLPSEELAKQFIDNLVEEVSAYHLETATEKEAGELELIQERADSIKQALSVAEYNLSSWYTRNSRALKASAVSPSVYSEKVKLDREAEILGQSYIEVMKGVEITKLSLLRQKPIIQIIDAPTYPLEKDEPNLLH